MLTEGHSRGKSGSTTSRAYESLASQSQVTSGSTRPRNQALRRHKIQEKSHDLEKVTKCQALQVSCILRHTRASYSTLTLTNQKNILTQASHFSTNILR